MSILLANLNKTALLGLTDRGTKCEALVVHGATVRRGRETRAERSMRSPCRLAPEHAPTICLRPSVCRLGSGHLQAVTAESPRDVVT